MTSSQRAAFVPPLMDAIRAEAKKRQEAGAANLIQNKQKEELIPRGGINSPTGGTGAKKDQSTRKNDENGVLTGTDENEPKTEAEPAPENADGRAEITCFYLLQYFRFSERFRLKLLHFAY